MGKTIKRAVIIVVMSLLFVCATLLGASAYSESVRNADGTTTQNLFSAKPNAINEVGVVQDSFYSMGFRTFYDMGRYRLYVMEDYGTLPILLYLPQEEEQIRFELKKIGYVETPQSDPVWYTLDSSRVSITHNKYTIHINNVFHGVDLIYRLGGSSIAEYIKVRSPLRQYVIEQTPLEVINAQNSFLLFLFAVDGRTFTTENPNGNLVNTVHGPITIEKSFWRDSNTTNLTRGTTYIGQIGDGSKFVKGIRFSELKGAVLPLYIDPTLNLGSSLLVADLSIGETAGDEYQAWMRWNISSIPAGATVSSATLTLFIEDDYGTPDADVQVSRVTSQTWTEGTGLGTFNGFTRVNLTVTALSSTTVGTSTSIPVTTQVASSVGLNTHFVSLILQDPDQIVAGAYDDINDNAGLDMGDITVGAEGYAFEDRENSLGSSNLPALSITYDLNLAPFFSTPTTDVTYALGEKVNITCVIENNLTQSTTASNLILREGDGSAIDVIALNQSATQSCGTLTTGQTCTRTWQANVTTAPEEQNLECAFRYTIGTKTSTIASADKQFNFINFTDSDMTLSLDGGTVLPGGGITAQMGSTITSFPYTLSFYNSTGGLITGCFLTGTTPATESQPFFRTCNVPGSHGFDNGAFAVFFLNLSAHANVTTGFDIINASELNKFFITNLQYKDPNFLGEEVFISGVVSDINGTPAVGECCVAYIEDVSTNVTISKTVVESIDGEGVCRVKKKLDQYPFAVDTSYKFELNAYECANPSAVYYERKAGSATGSFDISSYVDVNDITYPQGNIITAGEDRFEATFNFTNNADVVFNTITDCYYVDSNEQDFHLDTLDDIDGTINLGDVEQTFGSVFPSFDGNGGIFKSDEYLMECLIEFRGDSETLEIRRFRTDPFNVTASNDSVTLVGLTLSSTDIREGQTINTQANITSSITRRALVEIFIESNVESRHPAYKIGDFPDFRFIEGTHTYDNNYTFLSLDGRDIEDGVYVLKVKATLADGFELEQDAGLIIINGTLFDLVEATTDSSSMHACTPFELNLTAEYTGTNTDIFEVEVEYEDINADRILRADSFLVEAESGTNIYELPLEMPYVTKNTTVEVQATGFLLDTFGKRGARLNFIEGDGIVPSNISVTANLTDSCYYRSQQRELDYALVLATQNNTIALVTPTAINITVDNLIDYTPYWLNLSNTLIQGNTLTTTLNSHLWSLVTVQNTTNRLIIETLRNQTQELITLNDHQANQTLALNTLDSSINTQLNALITAVNNQTTAIASVNASLRNMSAELQVSHMTQHEDMLTHIASLDTGNFLLNQSLDEQQLLTLAIINQTLTLEQQTTNMTAGFNSVTTSLNSLRETQTEALNNLTTSVYDQTTNQSQHSANEVLALEGIATSIDNTTVFMQLQIEAMHNLSATFANQTVTQELLLDALIDSITNQTTVLISNQENASLATIIGAQEIAQELDTLRQDQNIRYDLFIEATSNTTNATVELKAPLEGISLSIDTLNTTLIEQLSTLNVHADTLNTLTATHIQVGQNITSTLESLNATQAGIAVSMETIASNSNNQSSTFINLTGQFANMTFELANLNNNLTSAILNSTATNQNFYNFVVHTLQEPIVSSVIATDFVQHDGLQCTGSITNAGINAVAFNYTFFITPTVDGNVSSAQDSVTGASSVQPGESKELVADLNGIYGEEQYCTMVITYDSQTQTSRFKFVANQFAGGPGANTNVDEPLLPTTPLITAQAVGGQDSEDEFPYAIAILIAVFVILALFWYINRKKPTKQRPPTTVPTSTALHIR